MSDPLDQLRPIDGRDDIYGRAGQKTDWTRMWLPEAKLTQAASINDVATLESRARRSIGDMVARDGDRLEGTVATVDTDAGSLTLAAGKLYVLGRAREIAKATFVGVPMTGEVTIGARVSRQVITHLEDPDLLGLHPGTAAQGEDGPVVEVETISWGWLKDMTTNDGLPGDIVPVYRLINGVIIDQTRPAELSVVGQRIELYDHEANGNYIVDGCEVFALGTLQLLDDADQTQKPAQAFSIAGGTANILGAKRTRTADMRVEIFEDPAVATVDLEPHTFSDGGSGSVTLDLRRTPVQTVTNAIVTKEATETVIRATGTDTDVLANPSVQALQSITQNAGAITYVAGTDYQQSGDGIQWLAGGTAPASGESYDAVYRYLDAVPVDAATNTSVTVSGGVTGEPVFIGYSYKLPRLDRLCLDRDGIPVYLKGQASASSPLPPAVPDTLLSLATITNTWFGTPEVRSDGVRNYEFRDIHRMRELLVETIDLVSLERLRRDLDSREPATKHFVFVDPFNDDRYRDSGEAQTAAVFDGGMMLPIEASLNDIDLPAPLTLAYTDEVVIQQELASGCMEINPYDVFTPPPAQMSLTPASDFWEENNTIFDDVTHVFGAGPNSSSSTSSTNLGTTTAEARFLRQIAVTFRIDGFGGGEILDVLTFDGIDITPADLVADQNGVLVASFSIPANTSVGTKAVVAIGQGGSTGITEFVGAGKINTTLLRRVTTISRWPNPPPPVFNNNNRQNSGVSSNGDNDRMSWNGDDRTMNDRSDGNYSGRWDPLAQTFTLLDDRMVVGIDVQFCKLGDRTKPVVCEIVEVQTGIPTTNVIAQTEVDLNQVVIGQWTSFIFSLPVYIPRGREYAFVFKTADPDHSLHIATRGAFMEDQQSFVGAQPYTIGVLLSSSNATTWTPHQNSDLTMRVRMAVFDPTSRVEEIGQFNVVDMSDLVLQAAVELPTGLAAVLFEIELDDTTTHRLEPNQPLQLDAYYTGAVKVRALLFGSRSISPVLFPRVLAVAGTLQAEGTYVSRAITLGENVRLLARLKTFLPTGATVTVDYDKTDDVWVNLPQTEAEAIDRGWQERMFEAAGITATQGRLKLKLTGNPGARPALSDLRTASL